MISYCILSEIGLVYQKWTGLLTLEHLMKGLMAFAEDPDFFENRTELMDLRGVTEIEIDITDMNTLMNVETSHEGLAPKLSVVIGDSDLSFGLSRQYQMLAENIGAGRVDVVRTEADALECLDRPEKSLAEFLSKFRSSEQTMKIVGDPNGA